MTSIAAVYKRPAGYAITIPTQCLCSRCSLARNALLSVHSYALLIKANLKTHLFPEIRLEKSTRLAAR